MQVRHQDPWIGKTVGQGGRYQLESVLGEGRMGRVYLALDQRLSINAAAVYKAIKFMAVNLAGNAQARERFQREMQACMILQDSHLIQVLDYGVSSSRSPDGQVVELPFLVMEWIEGETLEKLLEREKRLALPRAVDLARQIAAGLQAIHNGVTVQDKSVRFVHRDLKPSNIFLRRDALGIETVKLGDFGLVKFLGNTQIRSLTRTGAFGGTPAYASPEQLQEFKAIDGRADIYSLGCILYQMLTGEYPLNLPPDAGVVQWMEAHLHQQPQAIPAALQIPKSLEAIVYRCLEKHPNSRYSTAHELEQALRRILPEVTALASAPASAVAPNAASRPQLTHELESLLEVYQLQPKVTQEGTTLTVLLERLTPHPLNYELLIAEIVDYLETLPLADIDRVQLQSRQRGKTAIDWQQEFAIETPGDPPASGSAPPAPRPASLTLVEDWIVELLEMSLGNSRLRIQLSQEEDTLQIRLDSPAGELLDQESLVGRIMTQLQALQLDDIHAVLILGCSAGQEQPDWQIERPLQTSGQRKGESTLQPQPIPVASAAHPHPPKEQIPSSNRMGEEMTAVPAEPLQQAFSENQQLHMQDLEFLPELDLSQYCFVRNPMMLRTSLPSPSADIAQSVMFFHDLSDAEKRKVLPLLSDFFKDPNKVSLTSLPDFVQEWLSNIRRYDDHKFRSFAVWLSRYCADPYNTLPELSTGLTAAIKIAVEGAKAHKAGEHSPDSPALPSPSEPVLYRAGSHWLTWCFLAGLLLLLGLALALLIPSPLSQILRFGLPYWIVPIPMMVLLLLTLGTLLKFHKYTLLLRTSYLSIRRDFLFRSPSQDIQWGGIREIDLEMSAVGKGLHFGDITLVLREGPPVHLRFIANPLGLKHQMEYLQQQFVMSKRLAVAPAGEAGLEAVGRNRPAGDIDSWSGRTFGEGKRYRLESVLGAGGMGKVYRAMDQKLSIYVAVKFMLHGADAGYEERERFLREMQACLNLQDSRIVRVLDYGITDDEIQGMEYLPYMVMEYVPSPTLEKVLRRQPRMPATRVLNIAKQVAAALQAVHAGVVLQGKRVNLVHRDLKPSNVFVLKDALGGETIKLADFGLVKLQGELSMESLSVTGEFRGTPNYASPEQCEAKKTVDRRADIYSLGCVMYEMLSGENPFALPPQANAMQWLYAHVNTSPQPFGPELEVPSALEAIVMRCMAKDPQDRFNSALELSEALNRLNVT
jgi:serine/threonine protein kinase